MKTNQFNVTSRRRTAAEVAALVEDPDAVVFGGRVTDRFGDSGLTAVAIVTGLASARAEIDTLLLSCRVLGRGVEDGFWGAILNDLRRRGVREIAAQFRPSAKNAQVEGLWKRLGFVLERADESAHEYRANVASLDAPAAPWIEVTFQ
jgi:FkbH-like protein